MLDSSRNWDLMSFSVHEVFHALKLLGEQMIPYLLPVNTKEYIDPFKAWSLRC